jgi:hypothetical protein
MFVYIKMINTCGHTHYQNQLDKTGFFEEVEDSNTSMSAVPEIITTKRTLYTSYLGKIEIEVTGLCDTVGLEHYHIVNNKKLLIKVVDAQVHNLSEKKRYSVNKLESLSAYKISIEQNKYHYILTLLAAKKLAEIAKNTNKITKLDTLLDEFPLTDPLRIKAGIEHPSLVSHTPTKTMIEYKKIYQDVVKYNGPVEVLFNTHHFFDFLYEASGFNTVNNLSSVVSICNVPDLDNAFFTGSYALYGNGNKIFYSLTCIDVVGHELSHGLVKGTADLEYKGHSGALNEFFADIMGVMFEFYMYKKFPDLMGEPDWFIGEDLGMGRPYLRDMCNPHNGNQPKKYQEKFYMNPNGNADYGGVHINSGICNHLFYLVCQNDNDKMKVLKTFLTCLTRLTNKSNFMDFRNTLKSVSNNDANIVDCLNIVGFTSSAVSDYGKTNHTPQPQRFPQPVPQPERFPQPVPQPQRFPQPVPQPERFPQPVPQPQRFPQPVPQPQRFPQPVPQPERFPQPVPQP